MEDQTKIDSLPFKQNPGCRARVGADGTFCLKPECRGILCGVGVTSESRIFFPEPESGPLKSWRFRIHARDAEPESDPKNIARAQNRSHQDILLRARAPAAADTFQDSGVRVWARITQNS